MKTAHFTDHRATISRFRVSNRPNDRGAGTVLGDVDGEIEVTDIFLALYKFKFEAILAFAVCRFDPLSMPLNVMASAMHVVRRSDVGLIA